MDKLFKNFHHLYCRKSSFNLEIIEIITSILPIILLILVCDQIINKKL